MIPMLSVGIPFTNPKRTPTGKRKKKKYGCFIPFFPDHVLQMPACFGYDFLRVSRFVVGENLGACACKSDRKKAIEWLPRFSGSS